MSTCKRCGQAVGIAGGGHGGHGGHGGSHHWGHGGGHHFTSSFPVYWEPWPVVEQVVVPVWDAAYEQPLFKHIYLLCQYKYDCGTFDGLRAKLYARWPGGPKQMLAEFLREHGKSEAEATAEAAWRPHPESIEWMATKLGLGKRS